jgi:hypothetical protein
MIVDHDPFPLRDGGFQEGLELFVEQRQVGFFVERGGDDGQAHVHFPFFHRRDRRLVALAPAQEAGGDARDDRERQDFARDHGSGSDDGAAPHDHAREDHRAGADVGFRRRYGPA